MNHEVDDPRGWNVLDWETDKEERATAGPSFPFRPPSREHLEERLFPVTPATAERLLVTMTYDWGPAPQDEDEDAGRGSGRVCRCPDLVEPVREHMATATSPVRARLRRLISPAESTAAVTQYDGDFGFVVVSPEEVGVFWSFNPIVRVVLRYKQAVEPKFVVLASMPMTP